MEEVMTQDSYTPPASNGVIDCDVHNAVPSIEALFPYLSDHWRDYIVEHGIKSLETNYYPEGTDLSAIPASKLPSGLPPGSDLEVIRKQVLDPWNTQVAILNCLYGVQLIHNEDWGAAMARAVNDWQASEWLAKEPRLRASIVVASQNPQMAAEEIHRLGAHSGFVQVLLLVRSIMPYGKKHFWPIYEAAQQYGLAVGIHAGGMTGYPTMPVGWPSYYLEDYVSHAQAFQSQIVSMISEGVFKQFPKLKVVLLESGFTWMPGLMWRFDKNWKGLRREVPWVDRLPSEIIREHFHLTLQPLDESPDPKHLLETIAMLRSEDMLLFSTDYPHWQFDKKEEALPAGLSPELERKILSDNARSVYRF